MNLDQLSKIHAALCKSSPHTNITNDEWKGEVWMAQRREAIEIVDQAMSALTLLENRQTKVAKGRWLRLPSSKIVQVCKIIDKINPRNPDVSLRYVDDDGVMATGDFVMRMNWLAAHATNIDVAL